MSDPQPLPAYAIGECTDPSCRLRFPAERALLVAGVPCPHCRAPVALVAERVASHVTRRPTDWPPALRPVELLLDNLRSVYNVGSIFRTAEGVGVQKLHLAGITATPPHPRLAKTALGSQERVPWRHVRHAPTAVAELRAAGYEVWVLEDVPTAVSLFDLRPILPTTTPLLLVAGSEVIGVDPAILAQADRVIYLPMQGEKHSYNVTIAVGITLYQLIYR